jgi:hypothetical protein
MNLPPFISNKDSQYTIICEEYGYAWWLWEHKSTPQELKRYWKEVVLPDIAIRGCLFSGDNLEGKVTKLQPINSSFEPDGWVTPEQHLISKDAAMHKCHLHEKNDSWLNIKAAHEPSSETVSV